MDANRCLIQIDPQSNFLCWYTCQKIIPPVPYDERLQQEENGGDAI